MSSWISDVNNAAFQLESTGVPVIDKDIILALTEGLPDAFSTLIVTLDSILPHDLDLTNVVTWLLNEEVRQRNDRIGRLGSERNDEQALAVVHEKRPIAGIICFDCQGRGHYQSDCPQSWQQLKLWMEVTKMRLYLLSRLIMTMTTTPLKEVC